jgi:hypothetical protein
VLVITIQLDPCHSSPLTFFLNKHKGFTAMSISPDQLLKDLLALRNNSTAIGLLLSEPTQQPLKVDPGGFQPAGASVKESVQMSLEYTQIMRSHGADLKDDRSVDAIGQRIDQVRQLAEEMDKSLNRIS